MLNQLKYLSKQLNGDLYTDLKTRLLYATDASAYREIPLAVARPKDKSDLIKLVKFANQHKTSIIPRTAGTSWPVRWWVMESLQIYLNILPK